MTILTTTLNKILHESVDQNFIKDLAADQWYTKEEVTAEVERIAEVFKKNGLKPDDALIIAVPNSYRFVLFYLAALTSGITITSVNPEIPARELERILVRRPYRGVLLEEFREDLLTDQEIVDSFKLTQNQDLFGNQLLITEENYANGRTLLTESSVAIQMFTSGTTGEPKTVGISHEQLFAATRNIRESHQLTDEDITYVCLPLFHINAQVISLLSTILSDGKIVIGKKFSARSFWSIITDEKITWVSVAPAILTILLKRQQPDTKISHNLRFIRSASAPLAPSIAESFEKTFNVPVIESYGMTEAASQICINPLPPEKHIFGSVGKPYGLELKIVDEEDQLLAPEIVGDIVIRGANVIDYYVDRPDNTDFKDGWFYTGDVGYLNDEGYLFIVGRKKEVINRGGEKISPYEVEDVLLQLSEIDNAAVVGVPDPIIGQKVAAFIVLKPDITESQQLLKKIQQHCENQLSAFKRPEFYYFVKELPAGPTGKVQRKKLIEQFT